MENNSSTNNTKHAKEVEYLAMEEAKERAQDVKVKPGPGNTSSSNSGKPWKLNDCAKKRTSLEKLLLLLLLLVILLCILLIVVMLIKRGDKDGETNCIGESSPSVSCQEEVCLTTECVQLAGTMLSNMNPSINPCEDFYEFACGGWAKKTKIPEDRSRINVLEMLQNQLFDICKDLLEQPTNSGETEVYKKAKHFFTACMNEEKIDERGLDPLRTMLSKFGGWPVADDGVFNEDTWDLVDTLSIIRTTIGQHALFATDPKFEDIIEKKFYRLRIDQQKLGMGHRVYYLPDTMNMQKAEAYRVYMSRLAAEMREDHNQEEAMRQMNETFEFETELAKIQASDAERLNVMSMLNEMTIANLTDTTPQIDWLRYFQTILDDEITSSTIVFNFSPRYFNGLAALLERTPKRVLANFLMVRIAMDAVEYLSTRVRQIRRDFLRIDRGEMSDKPRWLTCTKQTNDELPQAVGGLFVEHYFNGESKHTAQDMYTNIRQALTETISVSDWMDAPTKEKALEKIKYTDELIGYESFILNTEKLNAIYATIDISPDTYFENIMRITAATVIKDSSWFGKAINSSDAESKWLVYSPVSANAWYYAPRNGIFVPAGILQPPFYSKNFPKSLNFGGIGMVLGHELSHGFDTRGRLFGKDGRLEHWWSNNSLHAYNRRAQCLVNQYSSYRIPEIDSNVDGERTQSENIADNGGLKAAFKGYKKWVAANGEEKIRLPGLNYTSEQLFFINFGQIWCSLNNAEDLKASRVLSYAPSRYRVRGTVSNSKAFADAFSCQKNSPMNPENKCELW